MLNATSFIAVLFVARKLGASFLVLLVAVPIIYRAIWTGNVDGFSFFGAALPTPVGLFFTALKPQNTLGLMLFWVFWMWRLGGLRRLSLTFAPVVLALVIAFTAFPPWATLSCSFSTPAHLAFFPAGVPAGLAILTLAIALKRKYLALAASPFLSPYVSYAAIVLMPLWGLMFLQDLARWLFRAGVLILEVLDDRRGHHDARASTH